jgi:hypothetical protein
MTAAVFVSIGKTAAPMTRIVVHQTHRKFIARHIRTATDANNGVAVIDRGVAFDVGGIER